MLACAHCGAGVYRVGSRGPSPKYCSETCRNAAKWVRQKSSNPCPRCGGPMARGAANSCRECQKADHGEYARYKKHGCRCALCVEANRLASREYRELRRMQGRPVQPLRKTEARECAYCESAFMGRIDSGQRFCSLVCAQDAQGRSPISRFRISKANRLAIYESCGWVCQLCSQPVRPDAEVNHPRYPTLDHVVPRSRGGSDGPENLRLACRQCNTLRGANVDWVPVEVVA